MLNAEEVQAFAEDWVAAWNAHDLPRILAHYRDDFTMSSPFIAQLAGEGSGTLHGKEAVAGYWRTALEQFADLRFELLHVLAGAESFVLVYRSVGGRLAAEVFYSDAQGLIYRASAHYG